MKIYYELTKIYHDIIKCFRYVLYLFDRKDLVQKYFTDQSDYYFGKLEKLENNETKAFYTHLLCSAMADGYEFFMFNRFRRVDSDTGAKFYKYYAIYHTIKFVRESKYSPTQIEDLVVQMFNIFSFSEEDKDDYKNFLNLYTFNKTQFEVDFSRFLVRTIFTPKSLEPVTLAFVINLLYTSYNSFVNWHNEMVLVSAKEAS